MKRSQPRRDWDQAHEKVMNQGGHCRVCGSHQMVQCAHVVGREHDKTAPIRHEGDWKPYTVHPDRIVPLCRDCHEKYDTHRLDLLPVLSEWEVHQAIADSAGPGDPNGFWSAGIRICGNELRVAA